MMTLRLNVRRVAAARWLLCGIALVGAAGAASAQTPEPDPTETARIRLGSFAFNPAIVASGGYDTNPYLERARESTFELYALPQIEGWFRRPGVQASFWGAAELVTFSNMAGARNWQVGGQIERLSVSFKPYVNYSIRNTNANPTGFEVGHKSLRIEGDLTAGIIGHFGRFAVSGSFRTNGTNWDADAMYLGSSLREKLNRRSTALRAGVGYSLTPLTSLEFVLERTTDRFKYSPIRDGDGTAFLWGMTFAAPAVIQGNAWLGYRRFHTLAVGGATFSGLIGTVTLVHPRPSGGTVAFRYSRDIQFSYDTSLAYYLSKVYELVATVPLAATWRVQAYAGLNGLDYGPAGSNLEGPLHRVIEYGGAVGYTVGQTAIVGVSANRGLARGVEGWRQLRVTIFLTYGSPNGHYQRLDRPIPFAR